MGNAGTGTVPYVIFRQALDAGDLARVRKLAPDVARVSLTDALRILVLMREDDAYGRAAVRWLGRLAAEARDVDLEAIAAAAAALDALPDRPDTALAQLQAIAGDALR